MFSVNIVVYNKKPKGPTLMELFTATGKLKKYFLTTIDVGCEHRWWHGTQRYDIQVLATHTSTWVHRYSSLLQRSVALGQRGHVAIMGRILCTKCTLHSNHRLTVWYCNTQNDFSTGAAIFSLHTLASPSGRNVKYNAIKHSGKNVFWFVPPISTGFVNMCPTVFLQYVFCNPGVHCETPCTMKREKLFCTKHAYTHVKCSWKHKVC